MKKIKKQLWTFSLYTIAVGIVILMLGCSESMYEIPEVQDSMSELKSSSVLLSDEFRFINKKYKIPEDIPIWEAQLNKVIENNFLMSENDLEMVGYQYIRNIGSQDELERVKSEMIDNNTSFPVYEDGSEKFTIVDQGMSKSDYKLLLTMLMPDSEYAKNSVPVKSDKSPLSDAVYFFEKNDLGLVNLEWKYEGKPLNTICLISEKKGIVFDNFLYFIHFVSGKTKSDENISITIPRLKSASTEDGDEDIQYTFQKQDEAYNLYGIRVWYYNIQCTVTSSLVGSQKSIADKSMTAYHDAAFGFSCAANIHSISFETGTNGHLDFAWGYAYGAGVSVSVIWNGSGFTISGGGTGTTGEEYVAPGELN
ncbi:hypothetical protein [Sunxiuqinia indica]|uniref:hypothetical protein n=1 Tax=Sunxiuqinia indica TaxID=2692584 RepID=UPI001357408E|nr:hypothetical protein [Sunxiuqinia indica]